MKQERKIISDQLITGLDEQSGLLYALFSNPEESATTAYLHMQSKLSAHEMLAFLLNEGEREAYSILLPIYKLGKTKEEREELVSQKFYAIKRLVEYSNNLSQNLPLLRNITELHFKDSDLNEGILMWDMAHAMDCAKKSLSEGYTTEDKTTKIIQNIYLYAAKFFNNWDETVKSYLIGAAMKLPLKEGFLDKTNQLINKLYSPVNPWKRLAFK